MIVSLRCDCAFFLEKLEIIMCRLWRPECVARHFLSPQEMKNTDEILDKLAHHITNISYRTYYRKRRAAIEALSTILWGFTAKETLDTLNKFFPE